MLSPEASGGAAISAFAGGVALDEELAFVQSRSVTVDQSAAAAPVEGKPSDGGTAGLRNGLAASLLVGVAVILAFVLLTNTWGHELELDVQTYKTITDAAPGFPDTDLGSAFTERFVSPWLAGTLAEVLPGDGLDWLWIIVVACAITTLALVLAICTRLRLGLVATLLCFALVALNPYALRLILAQPGPVDPVFVTGITIVLWALVAQRLAWVVGGALIALFGRQTALLAVPAAMPWLYAGEGWRERPRRQRVLAIAGIVAMLAVVYAAQKLITSSFTYEFAPSIPGNTILPVLGDPGTLSQLAGQTARVAAPLAVVTACLAGVLIGMARSGAPLRLPVEFWTSLLVAAAIVAQPFLISPNFEGFEGNVARLSALGVVPLTVALAYALRAADERLEYASGWAIAGGAVALLVGSLNDRGVIVGPDTNAQFVVLELIAAAVLAVLLAAQVRGGARGGSARRSD
jgi:hypothetical protein